MSLKSGHFLTIRILCLNVCLQICEWCWYRMHQHDCNTFNNKHIDWYRYSNVKCPTKNKKRKAATWFQRVQYLLFEWLNTKFQTQLNELRWNKKTNRNGSETEWKTYDRSKERRSTMNSHGFIDHIMENIGFCFGMSKLNEDYLNCTICILLCVCLCVYCVKRNCECTNGKYWYYRDICIWFLDKCCVGTDSASIWHQ